MNSIAVLISEDLEFDMAWLRNVFFYEHRSVAESRRGFADGAFHLFFKLSVVLNDPHALAATASTCFNKDRITYLFCEFFGGTYVRDRFCCSRYQRYTKLRGCRLCSEF